MIRARRVLMALMGVVAAVVPTAASHAGASGHASAGAVLTLVQVAPVDSLDPGYGYTSLSEEADAMAYLPLLTYTAKPGTAGTKLIPGLATSLPKITDGGRTYTLTLRTGLTYSNGKPVHAGDVRHAIERSITLGWGAAAYFDYIKGAYAYSQGLARHISGITVSAASRRIVFHLVAAFGGFENVLAFEAAAPVPAATPMEVMSHNPPVGVGPYEIPSVNSDGTFSLVQNRRFAGLKIPGVPVGSFQIIVTSIASTADAAVKSITGGGEKVLEPNTLLSPTAQADARAGSGAHFGSVMLPETDYFFLNTRIAPFNRLAARRAVNLALDRTRLEALSGGQLQPGAFFIPPALPGHVRAAYPYGDPTRPVPAARLARAKRMVTKAGLHGSKVLVWSPTSQPRQDYDIYLVQLLRKLGFRAYVKVVSDASYFRQVGRVSNHAQAGYTNWAADYPAPADFYSVLDGSHIPKTNNENLGLVDDGHIQKVLGGLARVPSSRIRSVAGRWSALDRYTADKAYIAPFGHDLTWKLASSDILYSRVVYNPVIGLMLSTVDTTE